MEKTQKIKFLISFAFAIGFFTALPAVTQAATLYFSPSSGTYEVGTSFTVSVYVSSADQAMNAASGVISFPSDKLAVESLSKSGSIFSLWVQEPSFSNNAGTVNFEGIVLNPGFTGASGKIVTVNFRVKAAGNAPLRFSSGSVLANDGKGTNILTELGDANFSLGGTTEPAAPEAITPVEVAGTPPAPEISSPTHPDPNKWYALKDVKFTWNISKDITGVRLLVGRLSNAIPTVTYIPPISERELTNLEDGIWYFSVQLRNDAGWGAVSRFRFQIDTEKPSSFDIREIERDDKTNPRAKFVFEAKDETSGIDHYEVQIDGESWQVWKDDGSGVFETPVLDPGKHTLIAKVFDKAGNYLANSVEFEIQALEPPVITGYPAQLPSGEPLIVKGTTRYPNAQTIVWLEREGEEAKSQIVRNDNKGNFTFVAEEKLEDGIYNLWAEVIDERGARSTPSEKVTISVEPPAFLKLGTRAISFLAVVVPLVALIFILLFIIWYSWHKFSSFRKRISKETTEAQRSLHLAFKVLKEEIEEQVAKLDGKPDLSAREKKIYDELKKALETSEKFIRKEIKDIKKEIKK